MTNTTVRLTLIRFSQAFACLGMLLLIFGFAFSMNNIIYPAIYSNLLSIALLVTSCAIRLD